MRDLLMPLGQVFAGAVRLKNEAFARGWRKAKVLGVPVVSVGNLTVGGTGKTPVIDHLLTWAVARGFRPGVVSRGYGRLKSDLLRVDGRVKGAPQLFGDEPTMLARRHPDLPIYVGPDRVLVGEKLLAANHVDVVFADDAFQHRRLHRDLDIVVLDATAPLADYRPLPWGLAREPMASLARASLVILSKVNLVTEDQQWTLREMIYKVAPDLPVVSCTYDIDTMNLPSSVLMVCGVGRPGAFRKTLSQASLDVVASKIYPDHHSFTSRDVAEILRLYKASRAEKVAITEKDLVKLAQFSELEPLLWVAQLRLGFSKEIDTLYEKIGSLLS